MHVSKCRINKHVIFLMLGIGYTFSGLTPHFVLADPPPASATKETTETTAAKLLTVTPTIDSTPLMVGRPFLLTYQIANLGRQPVIISTDDKAAFPITLRFFKPGQGGFVAPATFMTITRPIQSVTLPASREGKTSSKVVVKDWSQELTPGDYTMEITFHFRTQASVSASSETPNASSGEAVVCSSLIPVTVLPQDGLLLRKEVRQLQDVLSSVPPYGPVRGTDVWATTTLFFAYPGAIASASWQQFFSNETVPFFMVNTGADVVSRYPSPKIVMMLGEVAWQPYKDPWYSQAMKGSLRRIHEGSNDKALKKLVEKQFINHEGAWSAHPPPTVSD